MFRIRFVDWLKSLRRPHHSNDISQAVEDSLRTSAKQIQMLDPETEKQWQRMQAGLAAEQNSSNIRHTTVPVILWKPAISFALAAFILIAGGIFLFHSSTARTYETAKGQQSKMTLPDGSEVILNHTSELTAYHSLFERIRRVSLKGEAFFQVKKNGKPFIITTDAGTVQVLGTQFNVRVRDGRMEVAVISGTVKITGLRNGIDSSIILSQGQFSICAKNDFPELSGHVPFSEYPGWLHGTFMFYRTNLLSAYKEIESQFDISIFEEGHQSSEETITGTIDGRSAECALTALVRLTGKHFRHEGNSYIIY
ncbi:MAG: FecR family protein [Bacteroidota bacterium]